MELVARDAKKPTLVLNDDDEVEEEGEEPEADDADRDDDEFYCNLACKLKDDELDKIASELLELIADDVESRRPWTLQFKKGLKTMGLESNQIDDGAFPGAAIVTHPLMNEAIVQFWARAMAEVMPPEGPVKVKVIGKSTQEKEESATRVEAYMNYQCQVEDEGYRPETSRLIFSVPQAGSSFRKTFRNTEMDRTQGIYVPAEHFIVPFSATSLANAPRFTHRMRLSPNEVKKRMKSKLYRKTDLPKPVVEDLTDEEDSKLEVEKRDKGAMDNDARHEVFECYVDYTIKGYEDPDGIDLPFIITMEKESSRVLAIYRNWKKDDPLLEKRVYFTQFDYIPGYGFYGLGLFHLIGALSEAATGALRALLDAAAFSALQGGFKTKDATSLKGGQLIIEPGVWKDVDMTSEELSKAFYTPPFKEPSESLFKLLELLVESGRRFASITETMVGDADNKAPVGTTVALIEQGGKVFTAIHQGLHDSMAKEFKLRYEINAEYMPDDGYTYDIEGDEREVYKEDFSASKKLRVVPTSDPNMASSTHRIAVAQAVYQLSKENPQFYDGLAVQRRMLQAMKVPDNEELLIDVNDAIPLDPVAENQAILCGKMVKVFPSQDHMSHLSVHLALMKNPAYLANPMLQESMPQITAAMQAHIAQHLAGLHAAQMSQLGVKGAYMIDPMATHPDKIGTAEDTQIGAEAAKLAEQITQLPGLPPAPQPPDPNAEAQAKLQLQQQTHQQEMQQSNEKHAQTMQQERDKHGLAQEVKASTGQADIVMKGQKTQAEIGMARDKGQNEMDIKGAAAKEGLLQASDKAALDGGVRAEQAVHDQAQKEIDADAAEAERVKAALASDHERKADLAAGDHKRAADMAVTEHKAATGIAQTEATADAADRERIAQAAATDHERSIQAVDSENEATHAEADRKTADEDADKERKDGEEKRKKEQAAADRESARKQADREHELKIKKKSREIDVEAAAAKAAAAKKKPKAKK